MSRARYFAAMLGVLSFVLAAMVTPASAQTETSELMTFQGFFRDADGRPLTTPIDLTFNVYDVATGGIQVTGPFVVSSVQPNNGAVSVDFGPLSEVAFPPDASRYLGVQVDTDPELTPRIALTSVPYAFTAKQAGYAWTVVPPLDLICNDANFTIRGTNTDGGAGVWGSNMAGGSALKATSGAGIGVDVTTNGGTGVKVDVGNGIGVDVTCAGSPGIKVDSGAGVSIDVTAVTAADIPMIQAVEGGGGAGDGVHVDVTAGAGKGAIVETNGGTALDAVNAGVLPVNLPGVQPVIRATQHDVGFAVYGLSGAQADVRPQTAGVAGESHDQRGVAGKSSDSDGVYGTMSKTGTFASGAGSIVAGVQGSSATVTVVDNFGVAGTGSGYGTGVLGLGAGAGCGVLGVPGRDPGMTRAGVRGVTREGIGGGVAWPPYFALKSDPDKGEMGVLGQAWNNVGVWGESKEKVGVVGNTGDEMLITQLPAEPTGVYGRATQQDGYGVFGQAVHQYGTAVKALAIDGIGVEVDATGSVGDGVVVTTLDGIGVQVDTQSGMGDGVDVRTTSGVGVAVQTGDGIGVDAYSTDNIAVQGTTDGSVPAAYFTNTAMMGAVDEHGVVGESWGTSPDAAGVRASGNGCAGPGNPQAAALDINNGAIRVSGWNRPAGTICVPPGQHNWWYLMTTLDDWMQDHRHWSGWYTDFTLDNCLIIADSACGDGSIILLTVEVVPAPYRYAYYTQVVGKQNGQITIRVTQIGVGAGVDTPNEAEFKVHYLIINQAQAGM